MGREGGGIRAGCGRRSRVGARPRVFPSFFFLSQMPPREGVGWGVGGYYLILSLPQAFVSILRRLSIDLPSHQ